MQTVKNESLGAGKTGMSEESGICITRVDGMERNSQRFRRRNERWRIPQRKEFAHQRHTMRWLDGRAVQFRDRRLLRAGWPDGAHKAACSTGQGAGSVTKRSLIAMLALSWSALV